jgi:Arylsulfotransferase (ASST)
LVGAAVVAASCSVAPNRDAPYQHFHSRPDLKPPQVHVLTRAHGTAPGLIFIAPKKHVAQAGPLILDNSGHVVWFRPLDTRGVTDFRVQAYRGKPVLTWWRGHAKGSDEPGSYAIFDTSYRRIATVRPGNGLVGDIHEFLLTPRGTALITIFHRVRRNGLTVFEGALQELDVASYAPRPRRATTPYDYFHINSIDVDTDGNLLVSARNTHAVYKLSRHTGGILWRLGGKRSDFTFGPGTRFAWQHDARRLPDGTLSLFDNEAAPQVGRQSRVIVLRLDLRHRRAMLVRSFVHRPPFVSVDQGNAERLPDGHFFVGWGHEPYYTEFDQRGRMLLDARFGAGADSYRAYRFPWHGYPMDLPAVALDGNSVYVSWNGATDVARWQLLGGEANDDMAVLRTVPVQGFETRIVIPNDSKYILVRALNRGGGLLRASVTLHRG